MNEFFWGALSMTSLAIGLRFLRFWKDTHDRLFAFFALAFASLAAYWILLAVFQPPSETRHYFYLLRLLAFVLIIAGIVDKNLSRRRYRG